MLKNAPVGWFRVVVEADEYVPRIVGYARFDDQPRWQSYDGRLSRSATVLGRVTDDTGEPLADVDVRLMNVTSAASGRYESPQEYVAQTNADGQFHLDQVPVGSATIRLRKTGYCRPGLGQPITTPAKDILLEMMPAACVSVTVDFAGSQRPQAYIVQMEPEGGAAVGKWSGSGNIDQQNRMSFKDVPPGRYVLTGRPNPGSDKEQTEPLTIDLIGGKAVEMTLHAR